MSYLKTEVSQRNPYRLSKHRYLELVHYCQQYPEWKKMIFSFTALSPGITHAIKKQVDARSFEDHSLILSELTRNVELVERTAYETDIYLGPYLLEAVTQGLSFPMLKMKYDLACERDMYYDRYRKFFWLLSQEKGL